MDAPRLELRRVSKTYRSEGQELAVLHDVSLAAEAGTVTAVLGRSGCGKTTLLNLAGAMDFPTAGKVIVDGVVTSSLSETALTRLRREKVGFIFQSFQLLPTLSVVENVELPLLLMGRGRARAAALACLEWVEMGSYAERMPFQLSGGQMQRAAIARALVHAPSLLLADEPTGNLDSATSVLIIELLRRIASERGATVLMATHSQEAAGIADTIVRLRDGRVEEVLLSAKRA